MNNSCSILVQTINSCLPNKNNSCPQRNESRFDEVIHEHTWRGKGKECAKKANNFERFFR